MKEKKVGLRVLALHIFVLAGFSLMQGCTTGDCPVRWLNWPYSTPQDKPAVLPADDFTTGGLLPPGAYVPPPAALPAVRPLPSESTTYVVKKGDTLSGIAAAHGTSWKALADLNNLTNPNQLRVGQELRLPAGTAPSSRTAPSSVPAAGSPAGSSIRQGSSYVIQRGDSLSLIAQRSGLTVNEIKAANGLTSDNIIAGKSLTIPRKGEVKTPAVSKPAPAAPAVPSSAAPAVPAAPAAASLPAPAPIAEAAPVVPSSPVAAPVYEHVLYPGETLDDVARQYGSSKQDIMQLNNISNESAVRPGTKLLVPIPD